MKAYFYRVLIALDRFVNALCGGSDKETISHRWGDLRGKSVIADVGCKALDEIDAKHCDKATKHDEGF